MTTFGKMGPTGKNGQIGSHKRQWVTLGKIGYLREKALEKTRWVTRHTGKKLVILGKRSTFGKWVILRKIGVTFGKMGHIWKIGSRLENRSHLKKWFTIREEVTQGRIRHIWKNGSNLDTFFSNVTHFSFATHFS